MVRKIKKYANRKLYDTETKRLITLSEIAARISEGDSVQVMDNETGEDITTVVLAQIILEQEKGKREIMPISVLLQELVRRGRSSILDLLERSLFAPVEMIALTQEKVEEIVWELVKRRHLNKTEGQRLRDRLLARARESTEIFHHQIETRIHRIMQQMDVPTREELAQLKQSLARLHEKIEALSKLEKAY